MNAADYGVWRANFGRTQAVRNVGSAASLEEAVPAADAHSALPSVLADGDSKPPVTHTSTTWLGGDSDSPVASSELRPAKTNYRPLMRPRAEWLQSTPANTSTLLNAPRWLEATAGFANRQATDISIDALDEAFAESSSKDDYASFSDGSFFSIHSRSGGPTTMNTSPLCGRKV